MQRPPRRGKRRPFKRHNNNSSNNRNNQRPRHHYHRDERSETEKIGRRYDHLLEAYLVCRKKYFELYYKADPNQKNKLQRNYNNAIKQLWDFQQSLTPEIQQNLQQRFGKQIIDTTFSKKYPDLASEKENIEKINDPHTLKTQTESSFTNDQEESTGSLEDYKHFKQAN